MNGTSTLKKWLEKLGVVAYACKSQATQKAKIGRINDIEVTARPGS
jgi:hypothetical protein